MLWKFVNLSVRNCFQHGNLVLSSFLIRNAISKTSAVFIQTTSVMCKEPMKKKKRMDPALLKSREDRKKKRIEKEIKRLSKITQQYKPIDENEVALELRNSMETRQRPQPFLSDEELFERHRISKEWASYKNLQFKNDLAMTKSVLKSKEFALKELRAESEDLYREAIQLDIFLLPFKSKGPTTTPPIKNYDPIDGDIVDTTKKWDIE